MGFYCCKDNKYRKTILIMRKKIPLIIEQYPKNYTGYPFITLLQYNKQQFLTIINEIYEDEISAYVLDYCGPETVQQETLLMLAEDWFTNYSSQYPFSIHVSKNEKIAEFGPIHRVFSMEYITRAIGPMFDFSTTKEIVRRRKKKDIPFNVEIVKLQ